MNNKNSAATSSQEQEPFPNVPPPAYTYAFEQSSSFTEENANLSPQKQPSAPPATEQDITYYQSPPIIPIEEPPIPAPPVTDSQNDQRRQIKYRYSYERGIVGNLINLVSTGAVNLSSKAASSTSNTAAKNGLRKVERFFDSFLDKRAIQDDARYNSNKVYYRR